MVPWGAGSKLSQALSQHFLQTPPAKTTDGETLVKAHFGCWQQTGGRFGMFLCQGENGTSSCLKLVQAKLSSP